MSQTRLPVLPLVEWDCSPEAEGVCLCVTCPSNLLGVDVKANGSLVIGGGSGAGKGMTFPVRLDRDGVLSLGQVEDMHERAASVLAALGDAVYERMGTTCARDLSGQPMRLSDVAYLLGVTKQAVNKIERRALAKMRAHAHARECAEGYMGSVGTKSNADANAKEPVGAPYPDGGSRVLRRPK